ncbi:hypothetical protein [Nostoc sp. CCY0012]|uniref:hypothetical protein n=1 Tax=Nostoc sp. CCY0012 TaxID=1056123 RepID=UPI0039C75297
MKKANKHHLCCRYKSGSISARLPEKSIFFVINRLFLALMTDNSLFPPCGTGDSLHPQLLMKMGNSNDFILV